MCPASFYPVKAGSGRQERIAGTGLRQALRKSFVQEGIAGPFGLNGRRRQTGKVLAALSAGNLPGCPGSEAGACPASGWLKGKAIWLSEGSGPCTLYAQVGDRQGPERFRQGKGRRFWEKGSAALIVEPEKPENV